MEQNLKSISDLVSLCKQRGFIFQSSEIYGGIAGCYDYGPLGVELKKNIQNNWWRDMTFRENIVGIDSSILMSSRIWEASGHVEGFNDPMVDCKICKSRFREDQINLSHPCPKCGQKDQFTEPRDFNLMFKTQMGPVADNASTIYLRPETAQGIFVNFLSIQSSMRLKLPFGVCQIGKAFRNEITPGNFIFRMREFEQMEMQYFIKPGEQKIAFEEWKDIRYQWHIHNGLRKEKLHWNSHGPDELAHYADMAEDIEYEFPQGHGEIEGIHSRTDFDLKRHEEYSGKSQKYVDQINGGKKYLPYVIETSVGSDRSTLAILCDAYRKETLENSEERTIMKFKHNISPIKIAILPLMKKDGLEDIAKSLFKDIKTNYRSEFDTSGSIGKRYRRQDEIGTPFCITVDYDTKKDQTITIRNRDTMKQERVNLNQVHDYLKSHLLVDTNF